MAEDPQTEMTDAHAWQLEQLLSRVRHNDAGNFPLIQALEAAIQTAAELKSINALIARRPAMDKSTRYENIAHAIATAGKMTDEVARLEADVTRLESSLREVRERKDQRIVELVQELSRWKEEITDMAVVDWSWSSENKDNPRQMVADMIENAVRQALDPAISTDAVKLIHQGREALDAELPSHPCIKCDEPCHCGYRPCHGCYAHESP